MRRQQQRGVVLVAVAVVLTITAALAFSLNRQGGMASQSVEAEYDIAVARYLAEAGLNKARWVNQVQGCQNKPISPVAGTLAGVGSFSVVSSKAPKKNMDAVATGVTTGGATAVLSRTAMVLRSLDAAPKNKTLSATIIDTYLNTPFTAGTVNNGSKTLYLVQGQSTALLQFPLGEIPADAYVASATLTLMQNGVSAVPRPVSIHRVTAPWDVAAATWTSAKAGAAWSAPGGDAVGAAVDQTTVALLVSYAWDLTTLVNGWANGTLPNYGVLLKMDNALQSANFYSYENGGASRPGIIVQYYPSC